MPTLMHPVTRADRPTVDYTNWTNDDLVKLRTLQREEGAADAEVEAVESELRRRNPAPPRVAALAAAGPVVSPPAPGPSAIDAQPQHPRSTPTAGRTESQSELGTSPEPRRDSGPPPFPLDHGGRTFVSGLTVWLVFVALLACIGGGLITYYACDGLFHGTPRMAVTLIGAVGAATPYLAVVAFMGLASEAAQGVTWVANFMHEQN